MNQYLIGAGGTGAMCIRAYLCTLAAMQAFQPADYKVYIRMVDMDGQSDAAQKCSDLYEEYRTLRQQSNAFPEVIFENWDFTDSVKTVAKTYGANIPDQQSVTLEKLFTPATGVSTHTSLLMNTLYTDTELTTTLEKGFYGHPNIGAAVFNCVRDSFLSTENNQFMKELVKDLSGVKPGEQIRLYLFGSLFGGTGASVTPNLVDILRSLKNPTTGANLGGKNTLSIGVGMMMPYFKTPVDPFERQNKVLRPSSSKFMQQTREALYYYDKFGLVDKATSLLLLGTHELAVTSEIYARGEKQYQHFHLVLLVAAIGAYRFLNGQLVDPDTGVELTGALVWNIVSGNANNCSLILSELGLTAEEKKLDQMFRFCVMVSQFMRERYSTTHSDKDLRHYKEIIATSGQQIKGIVNHHVDLTQDQLSGLYREKFISAAAFCRSYINFYFDTALSGYDWTVYHSHKKYENGEEEVLESKHPDRSNQFGLRMADILNVKAADELIESDLGNDRLGNFTLRTLFEYKTVDEQRQVNSDFPDSTMQGLFKTKCEESFRQTQNNSLADIYNVLYNAAQ